MVRVSPSPPSSTSWWATSPRQPYGVHADAVDVGAAGAVELRAWWRPASGPARPRARASATSSAVRRAVPRGRVGLVRVVQLDDLDRLEVAARPAAAKCIISTAPMREVGRDQHADAGAVGQPAAHGVQPLVVEAGGADDGVDAVLDAPLAGCP